MTHGKPVCFEQPNEMPLVKLSILESQTKIGYGVTLKSWFTRDGHNIIRSETYQLEDGSVVAFQDCINGENQPLHIDKVFKDLCEGEPEFDLILRHSGTFDASKLQMYSTGR